MLLSFLLVFVSYLKIYFDFISVRFYIFSFSLINFYVLLFLFFLQFYCKKTFISVSYQDNISHFYSNLFYFTLSNNLCFCHFY